MRSPKTTAANIIESHFRGLNEKDAMCSARHAGLKMIQIYRLLTGEMPQAAGIDCVVTPDEMPAIEFAAPTRTEDGEYVEGVVIDVRPGEVKDGERSRSNRGDRPRLGSAHRLALGEGKVQCPKGHDS